jgi:hypothetical protein
MLALLPIKAMDTHMVKRSQGASVSVKGFYSFSQMCLWVAPQAALSPWPKHVNDRWQARKDDAETTGMVKGKSMRYLQQGSLQLGPAKSM